MDDDRVPSAGMDFSLLLPTRGRVRLVQRLFDSVAQTSGDVGRLEVVLYVDEDDHESRQIFHPELSLVKIVGHPGESMGSMNRACYDASHGRYVMLINDDTVFRTPGWDARVLDVASRFPDEIALIYGNDLDQGETVPTFPIISRTVCGVLGEICPPGYRNLHIESHILDIFKQLSRMGHERICYLDDVIFEHMHYTVGKGEPDLTSVKKNQRADDLLFIALNDERALKAKLLARHIDAIDNSYSNQAVNGSGSIRGIRARERIRFITRLRRIFPLR
jgi:hypothetical protein